MNENAPEKQTAQNASLPITIHAQFIKDLSFENPSAPDTLRPDEKAAGTPEMQVNVNLDSRPLKDKGFYEVVLSVEARARRGDATLFVTELQYGVVCSVATRVPEQHIHPLIMIEAPKLAFPFVRQIVCDLVIQGGYPPLMLNPVDFEGLYIAQYQAEQKKKEASQ